MHCNRGRDLLVNLQRAEWLPTYEEEGVRTVLREMNDVHSSFESFNENNNEEENIAVTKHYYKQCFHRNSKYISSYFTHRLTKIRDLRLDTGSILPEAVKEKLSAAEMDYFSQYSNLITTYNDQIGLDLASNLEVLYLFKGFII